MLLKKIILREKVSFDWKKIIFLYILGLPVWYVELLSEIALRISKILSWKYLGKENVIKIRIWRILKEIIKILNKKLNLVLEESKKKRIYIEERKIKFNPGKIKIYENNKFELREMAVMNTNIHGRKIFHPLIISNRLSIAGFPITHKPLYGQMSIPFKASHESRINYVVYNDYQKDNIIDRVVESFDAKDKEKELILSKALYERWNNCEDMIHINANEKKNMEILNKSFWSMNEEDWRRIGLRKEGVKSIMEEGEKHKGLWEHEFDFIEEFEMRKAYYEDLKTGKKVYNVEELAKYSNSVDSTYYKKIKKINKCMELYNLWELSDEEIKNLEIIFSKDDDDFEI